MKADIILVSDTSLIAWDTPSITCGLRGLCYMQVEVTGPDKDLHSGLYGGAVANPANVLADMIAKLVDADGHIAIPGFTMTCANCLTRSGVRSTVPRSTWSATRNPSISRPYRARRAIRLPSVPECVPRLT